MYILSNTTGNPIIPDFFIKKEENLEKIIEFILKEIPKNKPFFSKWYNRTRFKDKNLEILSSKNLLKRNNLQLNTYLERQMRKTNT